MISVVIPFSGKNSIRLKNLETVLAILDRQTFRNFEVIIVETIGRNRKIKPIYDYINIGIARIVYIPRQGTLYNLSWSRNVGACSSVGNKILFLDCDIVFDDFYLEEVSKQTNPYFVAWSELYYLDLEATRVIQSKKYVIPGEPRTEGCGNSISGDAGKSICMDREFFFKKVGGWNENYFGYGRDDNDMAIRTKMILGEFNKMKYKILHLIHPKGSYRKISKKIRSQHEHMWWIAQKHTKIVNSRLVQAELGKLTGPTCIYIGDLRS